MANDGIKPGEPERTPDGKAQSQDPLEVKAGAPPKLPRNDDNDDDRPRRRRRRSDRDDDYDDDRERGDATGGLIPYRNGLALGAYYTGVFSLIPCLGLALGPVAIVLGFFGLNYARKKHRAGGKAHSIIGIVLGSLAVLGHIAFGLIVFLAGRR